MKEELPLVKEKKIDCGKIFGLDIKEIYEILSGDVLKSKYIDSMSVSNTLSTLDNKFISVYNITPGKIESPINAISVYSKTSEDSVTLLLNIINDTNNLDPLPLQE